MRGSIVLIWLLSAAPAAAEIYKWTDDQGRVHYGDRAGGRNAEAVKTDRGGNGLGMDGNGAEQQQRLLQTIDEERAARNAAREQAAAEAQKRQRNCAYARDHLRKYRDAGQIYEPQADGGRRILSDSERQAGEAEARQAVRHWCGD